MKRWISMLCLALGFATALEAGSIRLKNNSNQKLRVMVEGADGSNLAEYVMNPQSTQTWTDVYGYRTTNRGSRKPLQSSDVSKTPYTVSWYCMSGDPYSICTDVAVGSLVMSDSCDGERGCNSKTKKGYPTAPEETQ